MGEVAHNLDITHKTLRGFHAPAPTDKLRTDDGNAFVGTAETIYRAGNVWVAWSEFTWVAHDVQGEPGFDSFLFVKNQKLHWQSSQRMAARLSPVVVGACAPTTAPVTAVLPNLGCKEAAPNMDCVAPTGGVSCATGDTPELRDYVYTFVRHYAGCDGRMEESAPSPPTLVETYNGDAVALTSPTLPAGVTAVRWYRSIAGSEGQIIRLFVGESLTSGFIDDKCVHELGEPLTTYRHREPPSCVDGVATLGDAMVVLWSGKNFWVSHPRLPHAYDTEANTFTVLYDIVGARGTPSRIELAHTYEMHLLTKGKPYFINGNTPENVDVREAQFWQPCLTPRSICAFGGQTIYASPYGMVSFAGEGLTNLTDNWLTEMDWGGEDPHNVRAIHWHERLWLLWPDKNGFVVTIASESGMRAKALVTHSVRGHSWYTRADVPLSLSAANHSSVHEWGRGAPMHWVWRSDAAVQDGLWKPSAVKVVSDFARHYEGIDSAMAQFMSWRQSRPNHTDMSLFFRDHPEFMHLYAQLSGAIGHVVSVFADGHSMYTRHIASSRQFRLPRRTRALEWSVQVSGFAEVREVHIQSSITDLTQGGGMS